MNFEEKVKQVLERMEVEAPRVTLLKNSGTRVLAEVVSPTFEGMDDGYRQRLAWAAIFKGLSDYESRRVEFVFTNSPAEHAEYIAIANGTAPEPQP